MAEAQNGDLTTASGPRGRVQEVRKQWAVHEDGALAYQIQNDEINQHYGLNRFHRRMVREDIPVAKFVQSEEELRQQEKRMRELEVLKAQAEEDAKMAKKISRQMRREVKHHGEHEAVDDEELARQLQEKEKKKYERHLERKQERKLKKEREILEAALAKDLEEARLAHGSENGSDRVSASMESLNLHGISATRYKARVTPSGLIEDDGDFSDFYNLPPEMDEFTRLEIQASQDEELATLLQEQEHKRTKAQVDQEKLRRIEVQDEKLARIMQEQEKLRLKKAKQKHQARKEARRQLSLESMALGASANTMNLQMQELPQNTVPIAMPINNSGQHRYRSNSYTRACDSPPSPPHSPPPQRLTSERIGKGHGQQRVLDESLYTSTNNNYKRQYDSQTRQTVTQSSSSSASSPIPSYAGPGRGMSTLESARQIAAGNPEGILAVQNSHKAADSKKGRSPQVNTVTSLDTSNVDTIHGNIQQESVSRPVREKSDHHRSGGLQPQEDPILYSQPYKPHGVQMGTELRHSDADEIQILMTHQNGRSSYNAAKTSSHQKMPQKEPAKSGFPTRKEDDPHPDSYSSGFAGFNIATAIDPTYQRRHPEASFSQETQLASHIPFSRSLPQTDGEMQSDSNLRGSLRKTKTQVYNYQDSNGEGSYAQEDIVEPVSSWQPVQGQRRRDLSSHNKSRNDGKGNCKQQ